MYRSAVLAWALWLANALVKWLRWGWVAYTSGEHWRAMLKKQPLPPELAAAEVAPVPGDRVDDPKN